MGVHNHKYMLSTTHLFQQLVKMRGKGTWKSFKCHTATLICRKCQQKVLSQNYRRHLNHPDASLQSMQSNSDSPDASLQSMQSNSDSPDASLQLMQSNSDSPDASLQSMQSNSDNSDASLQSMQANSNSPDASLYSMQSNSDSPDASLWSDTTQLFYFISITNDPFSIANVYRRLQLLHNYEVIGEDKPCQDF